MSNAHPTPALHSQALTTVVGGPYDLELAAGSIAVLQGPSGCGKSLLLRALADLDTHGGEVFCAGAEQGSMEAPRWRSLVAYVPAESGWWDDRVGPHLQAHSQRQDWLQALGLDAGCLEWTVGRCSSGERQRLALIAALCRSPQVLLLDEPSAACDAAATQAMEELLRAWLQQEASRAILLISHDDAQATRLADQRWQMDAQAGLQVLPATEPAHG